MMKYLQDDDDIQIKPAAKKILQSYEMISQFPKLLKPIHLRIQQLQQTLDKITQDQSKLFEKSQNIFQPIQQQIPPTELSYQQNIEEQQLKRESALQSPQYHEQILSPQYIVHDEQQLLCKSDSMEDEANKNPVKEYPIVKQQLVAPQRKRTKKQMQKQQKLRDVTYLNLPTAPNTAVKEEVSLIQQKSDDAPVVQQKCVAVPADKNFLTQFNVHKHDQIRSILKQNPQFKESDVDAAVRLQLVKTPNLKQALDKLIFLIKRRIIKPQERADYSKALTPQVLERLKKVCWEENFSEIWNKFRDPEIDVETLEQKKMAPKKQRKPINFIQINNPQQQSTPKKEIEPEVKNEQKVQEPIEQEEIKFDQNKGYQRNLRDSSSNTPEDEFVQLNR